MRRLRGLLAALVLAAAPLAAVAQDDSGEAAGTPETTSVAPPGMGEVYIENVTPQPLTFGLAPDNETWERFTLAAGEVVVFNGGPEWYFLIMTEGVELRYQLDDGGSYRLYWNEVDSRWDMMTCEQPACGHGTDAP